MHYLSRYPAVRGNSSGPSLKRARLSRNSANVANCLPCEFYLVRQKLWNLSTKLVLALYESFRVSALAIMSNCDSPLTLDIMPFLHLSLETVHFRYLFKILCSS